MIYEKSRIHSSILTGIYPYLLLVGYPFSIGNSLIRECDEYLYKYQYGLEMATGRAARGPGRAGPGLKIQARGPYGPKRA